MTRVVLFAVLTLMLAPSPGWAQIYAWRDANGTLVLSDRRLDAGAETYSVPGAATVRTTTRPESATATDGRYETLVQQHASKQGLRPDLVRAVIQVESAFNPWATSPKGAMGLMQLMPATARELGVRNAYDPDQNIRGGTAYLRQLLDRYDGNEVLALAAYNAGFNAVDRHGGRVPPYNETQNYVRKVGAAAELSTARATGPRNVIYKRIDIIDGRPVITYSSERPASGTYEIVGQ